MKTFFAYIAAFSTLLFPAIASAHTHYVDDSTYSSRHFGATNTVTYSNFTNVYKANDPRYIYEYNLLHATGAVNQTSTYYAPCNRNITRAPLYIRAINLTYARVSPNSYSSVVRMVVHGNNFLVSGETAGWYQVNVPDYANPVWVPKADFERAL